MAHPMRESAQQDHADKLHRMTSDYGAASGPRNNLAAPVVNLKTDNKPETATEFGAGHAKPKARVDKVLRGEPMKRAAGGGVIAKAEGGGVAARARGGRTKHKGSTHVNVIVAPQGAGGAGAGAPPIMPHPMMPPPGAPPMMPPKPPMMPPGAGGPPGMGMPPGAGGMPPPGALPPGMMPPHAMGGAVGRAKGGAVHKDAKQDKALIKETLHEEGLTGSKSERKHGGRTMTAGAESGVGRLEKIGKKPHEGKAQAV